MLNDIMKEKYLSLSVVMSMYLFEQIWAEP